jgi:hypothetical protein
VVLNPKGSPVPKNKENTITGEKAERPIWPLNGAPAAPISAKSPAN